MTRDDLGAISKYRIEDFHANFRDLGRQLVHAGTTFTSGAVGGDTCEMTGSSDSSDDSETSKSESGESGESMSASFAYRLLPVTTVTTREANP